MDVINMQLWKKILLCILFIGLELYLFDVFWIAGLLLMIFVVTMLIVKTFVSYTENKYHDRKEEQERTYIDWWGNANFRDRT